MPMTLPVGTWMIGLPLLPGMNSAETSMRSGPMPTISPASDVTTPPPPLFPNTRTASPIFAFASSASMISSESTGVSASASRIASCPTAASAMPGLSCVPSMRVNCGEAIPAATWMFVKSHVCAPAFAMKPLPEPPRSFTTTSAFRCFCTNSPPVWELAAMGFAGSGFAAGWLRLPMNFATFANIPGAGVASAALAGTAGTGLGVAADLGTGVAATGALGAGAGSTAFAGEISDSSSGSGRGVAAGFSTATAGASTFSSATTSGARFGLGSNAKNASGSPTAAASINPPATMRRRCQSARAASNAAIIHGSQKTNVHRESTSATSPMPRHTEPATTDCSSRSYRSRSHAHVSSDFQSGAIAPCGTVSSFPKTRASGCQIGTPSICTKSSMSSCPPVKRACNSSRVNGPCIPPCFST